MVKALCCVLWPGFDSRRTHLDFRMNHAYFANSNFHFEKGPPVRYLICNAIVLSLSLNPNPNHESEEQAGPVTLGNPTTRLQHAGYQVPSPRKILPVAMWSSW